MMDVGRAESNSNSRYVVLQHEVTEEEETGVAEQISAERMNTMALDTDMMSVLQNQSWKGDVKWFQYWKALERYIYKQDPAFKPFQFKFDVQEDHTGNLKYIIKPKYKKKSPFSHLWKFVPSLIGPLIGATVTFLLK